MSYVADSGAELFHHPHTTILQCAMGTDSITFSYIVRELEGKYSCHVFQCLTPAEVRGLHNVHVHVLMRDEKGRKKDASKVKRTCKLGKKLYVNFSEV